MRAAMTGADIGLSLTAAADSTQYKVIADCDRILQRLE